MRRSTSPDICVSSAIRISRRPASSPRRRTASAAARARCTSSRAPELILGRVRAREGIALARLHAGQLVDQSSLVAADRASSSVTPASAACVGGVGGERPAGLHELGEARLLVRQGRLVALHLLDAVPSSRAAPAARSGGSPSAGACPAPRPRSRLSLGVVAWAMTVHWGRQRVELARRASCCASLLSTSDATACSRSDDPRASRRPVRSVRRVTCASSSAATSPILAACLEPRRPA